MVTSKYLSPVCIKYNARSSLNADTGNLFLSQAFLLLPLYRHMLLAARRHKRSYETSVFVHDNDDEL